ncbi:hypothetical protein [Sinomicrobium sp.]
MATGEIKIKVTEYRILFLPFAKLAISGDYVVFSIVGFKVYQRAGDKKKFMFWMIP